MKREELRREIFGVVVWRRYKDARLTIVSRGGSSSLERDANEGDSPVHAYSNVLGFSLLLSFF